MRHICINLINKHRLPKIIFRTSTKTKATTSSHSERKHYSSVLICGISCPLSTAMIILKMVMMMLTMMTMMMTFVAHRYDLFFFFSRFLNIIIKNSQRSIQKLYSWATITNFYDGDDDVEVAFRAVLA